MGFVSVWQRWHTRRLFESLKSFDNGVSTITRCICTVIYIHMHRVYVTQSFFTNISLLFGSSPGLMLISLPSPTPQPMVQAIYPARSGSMAAYGSMDRWCLPIQMCWDRSPHGPMVEGSDGSIPFPGTARSRATAGVSRFGPRRQRLRWQLMAAVDAHLFQWLLPSGNLT